MEENIIARTIVQYFIRDKVENSKIQQSIGNYHMTLETVLEEDEFMSDIDSMDAFINKEVTTQ